MAKVEDAIADEIAREGLSRSVDGEGARIAQLVVCWTRCPV